MNLKEAWAPRAVAVGTITYSLAMTVMPKLLAKPMGLTTAAGTVSGETASLIRSIGTRDVALAAALLAAPAGYPMRVLTIARMVSDAADALWLGQATKKKSTRRKISGVALGWAALEAAVGLSSLGRGRVLGR